MRKIILIFVLICGSGALFLVKASAVLAACAQWGTPVCSGYGTTTAPCNCHATGCTTQCGYQADYTYKCITTCQGVSCQTCNVQGQCLGYTTPCLVWDAGGTAITQLCGPQQYACNNQYGCCDVGACEAAGSCPTGCGQGASTVPNGNCGTTQCAATGSCCSATDGGWSGWGTCQTNCTQTRTCTNPSPSCGGAGCSGDSTQACSGGACQATLTGTLFDASDMSSCPADIGTNASYSTLRFGNASFALTSTTPSTQTLTTNGSGTYSTLVYPDTLPKTYSFDYTSFLNTKRVSGIKLECQSPTSTVTSGGTFVKDTGFWRQYAGWWQVVGGDVYGADGITSVIPGTVLSTKQRLILPNASGKVGILSYGTALPNMLGTNPNAKVSDSLWEIQSTYGGLRYDYNFYKTRMDIFGSKPWASDSISTYDDGGTGYQVFKGAPSTSVALDSVVNLTGGKKVILLVDGDVTVNRNITVDNTSFLFIVANGNITFAPNVTDAMGWFVAENINVPCADTTPADGVCDKTDVQFAGEGSFVGWTNIALERDQGSPNNLAAAEVFTYRTDMLLNAPEPMKIYSKKFSPFTP